MAQHIVDALVVTLGMDTSKYDKEKKKVEKDVDDLEKKSSKTEKTIASLGKAFLSFFGAIAASSAIANFVKDVAQANDELNFLSRQLGISTGQIKAFQGAAAASGGSAEGMTNSMKGLNNSLIAFKTTGDASLVPAMNALNVAMVDAHGNIRRTDDVMLDLADSMHKMDAQQAYFLGQKLGLDDGTINTLIQGRDALQDMVAYQKTMYQASKQDLANSRELQKNRAILNSQWESMKTLIASAVIPIMNKLALVAIQFFEFLQRHQSTVKAVFEGLAILVGVSVAGSFTKALGSLLKFIAPFSRLIARVNLLAGAFVVLYNDYKAWAEGGNSLFKWDAFTGYIDGAKVSIDSLRNSIKQLWQDMKTNFNPTMDKGGEILRDLRDGKGASAWRKTKEMIKTAGSILGDAADTATGHNKGTASGIGILNHNDQDFSRLLRAQAIAGGITDKREIAAFTAITAHETGDGRRLSENANYSYKGWQRLAPNQSNIRKWLASHSEADFNKLSNKDKLDIMYAGMNGNRAGEGYKFRGRGAIQLTGRANYEAFAKSINRMDILDNPDIVGTDKELAAKSAVWFWNRDKRIGNSARNGDIATARRLVNGGTIGMDDVMNRYNSLQQAQALGTPSANVATQAPTQGNKVDVKVGDINVNTSSSTVSGVTQDAIGAINKNISFLISPMR